ncbi:hypothetical protein, partial [Corynebacterium sp.]|uniref:hypothetical protein n=1 Tax=Corynebacterium sp. TaxID=1720 RepID=UPI00290D61CC
TDHTILRILVKFSWHIPDFPIYSNGTKPGTLHTHQTHWNHTWAQYLALQQQRSKREKVKG